MTAEWLTAIASIGTFVVIAATAVAAIIQLRHIRSSNQLAGLLNFTEAFESDAIQGGTRFVADQLRAKLRDPAFVRELLQQNTDRRDHPELRVCDFLEQQGSYIKFGMIDRVQYVDLVGAYVTSMWDALVEVVALRRAARNSSSMYENFEYLASLAAQTQTEPLKFPGHVPVLLAEEQWRELAKRSIANAGLDGGLAVSNRNGVG